MRHIFAGLLAAALIMGPAALFLQAMACDGPTVRASWYGPGFQGKRTASGAKFNMNAFTAAHPSLPFGSKVRVTYRGKSVVVRINDRGPFMENRSIDLSKAAARKIGILPVGVAKVCMERL